MMRDPNNKQRTDAERGPRSRSARPEASVNMDELRELIALLRDNGLSEFELEREGFRVRLRRGVDFEGGETATGGAHSGSAQVPAAPVSTTPSSSGAMAGSPVAAATVKGSAPEDQDLQIIPSPIVGTYYRSRSPNAEPFVTVGSRVEPASVVCIIEAMKLMNEIQAEATGAVAKIYVENGQPVEYGQPLFGIRN
jgi:acetyl-CoA carboxylase biotin carboxyl carrier protein